MLSRSPILSSIAHEMDRLFENLASTGPAIASTALRGPLFPALNVWEDDAAVHVEAELPGVNESDLDISIMGSELTIRGSRTFEAPEKSTLIRRERATGAFERTLTLPVEVDGDTVTAGFVNGVLTITLPKAPSAMPRRIEVRPA